MGGKTKAARGGDFAPSRQWAQQWLFRMRVAKLTPCAKTGGEDGQFLHTPSRDLKAAAQPPTRPFNAERHHDDHPTITNEAHTPQPPTFSPRCNTKELIAWENKGGHGCTLQMLRGGAALRRHHFRVHTCEHDSKDFLQHARCKKN